MLVYYVATLHRFYRSWFTTWPFYTGFTVVDFLSGRFTQVLLLLIYYVAVLHRFYCCWFITWPFYTDFTVVG